MASASTESVFDEDLDPDVFSRLLDALQTCSRDDRDHRLFFEPSSKRLDLLRCVLLYTDRDGSFERQVTRASSKVELSECIFRALRRLNHRRADEFAEFVKGAASVDDQKRLWTLLLETAAYAQKKKGSRKGNKSHDLTFEPPVTSTPLQSLPPKPLAKVELEEDADDTLKKSSASGRQPLLPSSCRGLVFAPSGEEMAASVSEDPSVEQITATMESRMGFSTSRIEPTVIAAGGSLGESGCGDVRSKGSSQRQQVPDKKLCEEFLEAKRSLCMAAESLVEGVEARLAADAPQRPMIDFDGTAIKKLHDAVGHFELLTALARNDT